MAYVKYYYYNFVLTSSVFLNEKSPDIYSDWSMQQYDGFGHCITALV